MVVITENDGAALLNDTRAFIGRFCALPDEHALNAATLWAAHCHIATHFYTSPRLAVLSPELGSGKTRVLEVLALLTPAPLASISASPAAIFRTLADGALTLLFDEVDTIFSRRGKDNTNEDLRALLNSGYKRGATVPRCVGPKHEVQHFPVFCPVALAGIGNLPDTIMSRSIIIRMRRRAPHEVIESFRSRVHEPEGHSLRDRLSVWADATGVAVGEAYPEMPPGIVDRPAEVWEPLVAVADAAGGHWPETARSACVALCKVAEDRRVSLGIRLLADLRTVFGDEAALHTETILCRLINGEDHRLDADSPWADFRGHPLGSRDLARLLKRYGVSSAKIRIGDRVLQGYRRADLWDSWRRYLPAPSRKAEPPEHAGQCWREGRAIAANVPGVPDVPKSRAEEGAWEVDL